MRNAKNKNAAIIKICNMAVALFLTISCVWLVIHQYGKHPSKNSESSHVPEETNASGEHDKDLNPIVNINDDLWYHHGVCEAFEKFFEDEDNVYYFGTIRGNWIIVYYEDGSREDILTAFEAGRASIADLDKFSVDYIVREKNQIATADTPDITEIRSVGKHIVNIVDRAGFGYGDAEEKFFEDEDNEYYFRTIRGNWIIVYYADGSQEDILTAFDLGRASIADLEKFSIDYITKEKKN